LPHNAFSGTRKGQLLISTFEGPSWRIGPRKSNILIKSSYENV
jgi:hypothetical protein